MAEIRLQYRWVPSALEPLPSLTHEGPWCRDAVPTGYKLEQRSYCCHAMGFSLGQWQRHPETKRRIMVAGSGATYFDKGARRDAIIVAGPSIGFSRHGEIFCDGTRTDAHDKAGILPMPAHRSEFPPAIPRRVASQQSPLPLRRIRIWNQEQSLSSRSCFRLLCLQKNSPPPLDSAHISCRLCCNAQVGSIGPEADSLFRWAFSP
jgi:hypothetical protein